MKTTPRYRCLMLGLGLLPQCSASHQHREALLPAAAPKVATADGSVAENSGSATTAPTALQRMLSQHPALRLASASSESLPLRYMAASTVLLMLGADRFSGNVMSMVGDDGPNTSKSLATSYVSELRSKLPTTWAQPLEYQLDVQSGPEVLLIKRLAPQGDKQRRTWLAVINLSPIGKSRYQLKLGQGGNYRIKIHNDAARFGGSGKLEQRLATHELVSEDAGGADASHELVIPYLAPYAALVLDVVADATFDAEL